MNEPGLFRILNLLLCLSSLMLLIRIGSPVFYTYPETLSPSFLFWPTTEGSVLSLTTR